MILNIFDKDLHGQHMLPLVCIATIRMLFLIHIVLILNSFSNVRRLLAVLLTGLQCSLNNTQNYYFMPFYSAADFDRIEH